MQATVAEQQANTGSQAPNGRCIVCKQAFGENADDRMEAIETDNIDSNKDPFHASCHQQWTTEKVAKCLVVERILRNAGLDDGVRWSSFRNHETGQLTLLVHANWKEGKFTFSWDGGTIRIHGQYTARLGVAALLDIVERHELTCYASSEEDAVQFVRLLDSHSRMMTNEELAQELKKLDPTKPLGKELHTVGLRVFATQIAIEAVAIRNGATGLEVLLRQRGLDEPSYPGQWHCPGSFVRSGENAEDVLRRLTERESLGEVVHAEIVDNAFVAEERGWYCGAVYLVEVKDTPEGATWFPVKDLPEPTIDHHKNILIPMAVAHFRK